MLFVSRSATQSSLHFYCFLRWEPQHLDRPPRNRHRSPTQPQCTATTRSDQTCEGWLKSFCQLCEPARPSVYPTRRTQTAVMTCWVHTVAKDLTTNDVCVCLTAMVLNFVWFGSCTTCHHYRRKRCKIFSAKTTDRSSYVTWFYNCGLW